MSSELQYNTPDDSQNSNVSTQPMESPSEQSESVWGRLIPVCQNHDELSLNQVFEFREECITIGRGENNDVSLKCPNVSTSHCKIIRNISGNDTIPDTIFLEDTSTNGTWLDKKKISKTKVLINDGSEIILVPGSKKRKRKKLSYFFHLENKNKKSKLSAKSDTNLNTLESKYYVIRDLGKGAFSTVKLVQDRITSKKYALKVIDRNSWQRMKHATNRNVTLLDEVEIMKKANHSNIVKVYEYFEEEKVVNVILDYCTGGDMLEYIQDNGAYSSLKGRKIFKQLIDAVNYLHNLQIAHRDLKPDNILLTDKDGEHLKLSDFGISREQTSAGCGTIIGTPLYQAPEVHLRRSQYMNGYDGTLADYWSLGIILYVMLVAAPPISTKDSASKIIQMSETKTLPWYDEPIPETAKDLIYKLLSVDPQKRITSKDIYKHPWILGYDTFESFKKKDDDDDDEKKKQENGNCDNNNNNNNCNSNNHNGTDHVQQKLGSIELTKSGTSDSKQEENSQSQQTQNGEENIDNDVEMSSVTPTLSTTIPPNDNSSSSTSLSTSLSSGSSVLSSSLSNSSASWTTSSSSSMSRKRKAEFNDDDDSEISKPPAKKQKSDPNGIQQSDLMPIDVTTANSV